VVRYLIVPGHIESWLVVIDFKNVSLTQIPVKQLKGFIKALQVNFRGRLYRMISINSHWLLRGLWNAVYSWFDEYIKKKITICGYKDATSTLLQCIREEDLE